MNKIDESVPLLSGITVTWNAKKYVDECLRSLDQCKELPLEIIVVDNASTDGTTELIAKKFANCKLIRNAKNLGFAKANNVGIKQSRGKYICLINSDVVLPSGCLTNLFRYMEANPSVGIVGPQMLGPDGAVRRSSMRFPSLRNSVGRAIGADRLPLLSHLLGGQMMSDFNHNEVADVEILNGWFWMIRREALEQIGLLDERFFIFGEDMDWCRRFREAGWRLVFYPKARAIHYGGASSSAAPVRFYVEMQRANLRYWRKHHGMLARSANYGIVFAHHVLRLVAYSVIYMMGLKKNTEAAAKIRRSWALLTWMLGAQVDGLSP
jgi:GT2 family glycosyltransferase